jgi:hypothetical protein
MSDPKTKLIKLRRLAKEKGINVTKPKEEGGGYKSKATLVRELLAHDNRSSPKSTINIPVHPSPSSIPYENRSVIELKALAKDKGFKGYSTKKKQELIDMLRSGKSASPNRKSSPKRKSSSPKRKSSSPKAAKAAKKAAKAEKKARKEARAAKKAAKAAKKAAKAEKKARKEARAAKKAAKKSASPKRKSASPKRKSASPKRPSTPRAPTPRKATPPVARRPAGDFELLPRPESAFLDALEAGIKKCKAEDKLYNAATKRCVKQKGPNMRRLRAERNGVELDFLGTDDFLQKYPRRPSTPKRKSSSPKRKSPKAKSPKRKSPKRKSPKKVKSPKRKSPKKARSPKRKAHVKTSTASKEDIRTALSECLDRV